MTEWALWLKAWGPQLEKLQRIEQETGQTPRALLDMPRLAGVAKEVADAYDILSPRRTVGMMPGPVSLRDILAYFEIYGPPTIPKPIFVHLIGLMDAASLPEAGADGNKPSSKR